MVSPERRRPPAGPGLPAAEGATLLARARASLDARRPQEALPLLDRAVAYLPASAEARLLQGQALEALGWPAEAAEAYRHATTLTPRAAEPWARLGIVLRVQDRRAEAAAAFRKAATLAPQTSTGRLAAAYAALATGDAAAAEAALRRLVKIEPRNGPAHAELGKLLAEAGDADGALAAFDRVLALDPQAVGRWHDRVRIRRLTAGERPLLERMQQAAARPDLRPLDRVLLQIALGKAHDDFDDPAAAMRHYLEAGRLQAAIRPLDLEALRRRVDWLIDTFDARRLPGLAAAGDPDPTPLLIVGLPRSGTTLVESILAAHPQVSAGEELPFWSQRGLDLLLHGDVPAPATLRTLAADYLGVLRGIGPGARVTDKKPDNFTWLGLVHAALPSARIVHCRREPLDTAVSIVANFFAPRPDFSTEATALVAYIREHERLMAHWRRVLPPQRLLELDYEVLVTDPEPAIRRLLDFAGLPWDGACLHPEAQRRRVTTASLWQVRQPIAPRSVARWRRYEPWLGPLAALQR